MAVIEKNVLLQSVDASNNAIVFNPLTVVKNVEGAVASINNILPDDNGNVTIDLGEGSVGSLPIGFIFFAVVEPTTYGAVEARGQELNRNTYLKLWQYAQDSGLLLSEQEWQIKHAAEPTNVPYYSDGDGATTFRVPQLGAYNVMFGKRTSEHKGRYCIVAFSNITNAGSLDVADILAGQMDINTRLTKVENIKHNAIGSTRTRATGKYNYGQ